MHSGNKNNDIWDIKCVLSESKYKGEKSPYEEKRNVKIFNLANFRVAPFLKHW